MVPDLAAPEEAHVSYCCSACEVNWSAEQAEYERCPMCGGAVAVTEGPASEDADLLYRIVHAEAEKRDVYANFDRYHSRREAA
jgi:DNA-directed RNA polymerase subunit RPC12/RpoP